MKKHTTPQSLNAAIKSICDIMRRSNCAGALQYVPELTWILFLRILDEREEHERQAAEAVGAEFVPSLEAPYRWRDWAAPPVGGSPSSATRSQTGDGGDAVPPDVRHLAGGDAVPPIVGGARSAVTRNAPAGADAGPPGRRRTDGADAVGGSPSSATRSQTGDGGDAVPPDVRHLAGGDAGPPQGWKRAELQDGPPGSFFSFVSGELIPHLKGLKDRPNATPRQKVISEIFSGVERTRIDTERNLLDVLDKVHEISAATVDPTHVFTLSQVYEGLLLKMGEKGNDGGQFFTPREIIRVMVRVVDPKIGETVYDPGCGTGGFLAQAFEHMAGPNHEKITSPDQLETLKRRTFYGREKDNAIYPIALANLVLHHIDEPHIWHGNTLTGAEIYGGLFQDAPALFDVVLMNPPFGGKEGKEAQTRFAYKTSATQVLFLQHVMDSLKPGGRCGIVLDEGVLFRTNEQAFVQTKRKLLDDCDVWCIVSLPPGTFVNAGAGVKANLMFFTKGRPTERIWYYDLSDVKVGKKTPLTLGHFEEFFRLLESPSDRADKSDRSWVVSRAEIEARGYDLKAVNPHRKNAEDTRTPEELLALIEAKGREVAEALAALRR